MYIRLPLIALDSSEDGVSVDSYGQGQLTGVTYTVPAHGDIEVDFELHLLCVTPADIINLDNLVKSLLDASKQHLYSDLAKTDVSGGLSFFDFLSGGVKASYSDTKRNMEKWGFSPKNQGVIIQKMMEIAMKTNDFSYKGEIKNTDYDYSVTGNLFGIVMDCTIKQGSTTHQIRALAPKPHLQDPNSGATLPTGEKLY